jgi:hypothetical protein
MLGCLRPFKANKCKSYSTSVGVARLLAGETAALADPSFYHFVRLLALSRITLLYGTIHGYTHVHHGQK